jgi:hypothetical protein
MNFTMPDGSTIWFKCIGSVQVDGDKVDIKGTGVGISGTGRLAGAKADVSWTGQRMQVTPTTGAELYADMTITVKTPSVAGK